MCGLGNPPPYGTRARDRLRPWDIHWKLRLPLWMERMKAKEQCRNSSILGVFLTCKVEVIFV